MFALPEAWVWDSWIVDDGERYHLFFLHASKALRDPDARHHRAAIGHAVSDDLTRWERTLDALVRSDAPAFDDLATWTGSVVRRDDGTWFLFYTGATLVDGRNVQSIGYATSSDLLVWDKQGQVLAADPRWYERVADGFWHDEAFRDPWVLREDDGWRMLITARANHGAADDRGVVGTAVSRDLRSWELQPPLTEPGSGFGQLEVMETVELEGRRFLLFSCLAGDLAASRRATGAPGGIWVMPTHEQDPRWDPREAVALTGDDLYVGRVARRRDGQPVLLAFRNRGPDGAFVGELTDPMPLRLVDGVPTVAP